MSIKIQNHFIAYTLFNSAKALVSILGPIYLYRVGYSFRTIIVFFIITAVFKVAALPIVFKAIARFGNARVMKFGVITMCLHFAYFATIQSETKSLVPLAFLLGIANASFYPPFRVGFSKAINKLNSGAQAAHLNTLTLCFGALAPVIGGIVASLWGVSYVYVLAIVIFLLVPIFIPLASPDRQTGFNIRDVPRGPAWRQYVANACYSFSGLADMLVWPLFLSLILSSYAALGAYAGLLVLLAAVVQLWTGRRSDQFGERSYLLFGTGLQTLYNLLRVITTSLSQILSLSILSAVSSSLIASAYSKQFYDNVQESKRLESLFGLELANSLTWLIYFPVLLAMSYLFTFEVALKIGVLIIVPATVIMAFMSTRAKVSSSNNQTS